MGIDSTWLKDQVDRFQKLEARYVAYADLLEEILKAACRSAGVMAIVGSRPKSIHSFTEKCIRKHHKYDDPVSQLTDLCGARAILHTRADVEAVSSLVEQFFEVDRANSLDTADVLKASEFGYRGIHFVVQLKQHDAPANLPVELAKFEIPDDLIPDETHPFKAEIQIRTIVQHAWADIGHDRIYKSRFSIPKQFERESARVAALLEDADEAFQRLVTGVDAFRIQYDAYMDKEQIQEEIEILEMLRERIENQQEIDLKIARLYSAVGDWKQVIKTLRRIRGKRSNEVKTFLGHALCTAHARHTKEYQHGRELLHEAANADPPDLRAVMHMADETEGDPVPNNQKQVAELYERAFRMDPTHPRAFGGYLETKIRHEHSLSVARLLKPMLEGAVDTCLRQAEVGVHLPDALYRAGEFLLLLDRPYEALTQYCRAVSHTTSETYIDAALLSLDRISDVTEEFEAAEWARIYLLLAKSCKFHDGRLDAQLQKLSEPVKTKYGPICKERPVVIVAGSCDPRRQNEMNRYNDLLRAAFSEFQGTVISGGTQEGISGLVGELGQKRAEIQTIGYVPDSLPTDGTATMDTRYKLLRRSIGKKLSARQPLQNWIDLMASGFAPAEVTVLGINGGRVAGFEYRLATSLGAKVGVLRDSGRVVGVLSRETQHEEIPGLALLPHDEATVRAFVEQDMPSLFDTVDERDEVARKIHEDYVANEQTRVVEKEPTKKWVELKEDYKQSNRRQAEHIRRKLDAVGLEAVRVENPDTIVEFPIEPYVEQLAEREHARWVVEKLLSGWEPGKKRDEVKKIHPCLVSWKKLPIEEQDKDRKSVLAIPKLLKSVGFEIRKKGKQGS